jgi:type III secretory pathway component EscV
MLDPGLEHEIGLAIEHGEQMSHLRLPPDRAAAVVGRISALAPAPDAPVVLVTGTQVRYFVRQLAEAALANVTVISHAELPPGVRLISLGSI